MALTYVEYRFSISPKNPWEEILLAELQELPFESFLSTEKGLNAYVPASLHQENFIESIALLKRKEVQIKIAVSTISPKNWNAIWESEFHPIFIGDDCVVRADFHDKQHKKFELIVNPKMSFGTGHHPTTHMMLEFVLEELLDNKRVLDMGCGTGVLGILASKKGASTVDAIDYDPWCVDNTIENATANLCKNINAIQGETLDEEQPIYDFIFANINRNVLTEHIPSYSKALKPEGALFLSGFYHGDIKLMESSCQKENLTLIASKERETWCALKFAK